MGYDPFGQPEAGTGLGAPTDHGFTGEPQDAATGLVQLRARWYQPTSGQFVSRDPFGGDTETPQTFSHYAYAHSDPINGTDPTGQWRWQDSDPDYHQPIEEYIRFLPYNDETLYHFEFNAVRNVTATMNNPEFRTDILNVDSAVGATRGGV